MTNGNGRDETPLEEFEPTTEEQAMEVMIAVAGQMGWDIIIPEVSDNEEVPGLIMGTPNYIKWIEEQLTDKKIPVKLRYKK